MNAADSLNRRVLVIDDHLSIHEDFRRILAPPRETSDLDAEAAALFGDPIKPAPSTDAACVFALSFAAQGEEGRNKARAAREAGEPFALAFVDMRMPPGWDGLTTIRKIWEIDPALQIVICTAHADRSWEEIAATLPERDSWAVLKKPFDKIEVVQFAHVMTAKWNAVAAAHQAGSTAARV